MSETALTSLTTAQTARIARQIKADLQGVDVDMHNAAARAMRVGIGLVMVRDLGEHGDLEKFKREHFEKKQFRTLENYIRIADACLKDTGLRDAKTRELGDGVKVVLAGKLTLAKGGGKPAASIQLVRDWINERGVFEILSDLRNTSAAASPPVPDGDTKRVSRHEQHREAMLDAYRTFKKSFKAKYWHYLDEEDLTDLSNTLTEAQLAIGEKLKAKKKGGEKR